MKNAKLSLLAVSLLSVIGLTQCVAPSSQTSRKAPIKPFNYPQTRVMDNANSNEIDAALDNGVRLDQDGQYRVDIRPLKRDDGIENYYGDKVVDKYRWLEEIDPINPEYSKESDADRDRNLFGSIQEYGADDPQRAERLTKYLSTVYPAGKTKSEVEQWVDAQNNVTTQYISSLPLHSQIKQDIESLYAYNYVYKTETNEAGKFEMIRDKSGYYKLFLTDKQKNKRVLLDERALSDDGSVKIYNTFFSPDGHYIAYLTSEGSADADRINLYVIDNKGKMVTTPIDGAVKESSVAWKDNHSFYYLHSDEPPYQAAVYFRDLDKPSFRDSIIVPAQKDGSNFNKIWLDGENDRYLIIGQYNEFTLVKDLQTGRLRSLYLEKERQAQSRKDAFMSYTSAKVLQVDNKKNIAYILSQIHGENGEIIAVNLEKPDEREVVVPLSNAFLMGGALLDDHWILQYQQDGYDKVVLADAKGKTIRDITPIQGSHITDLQAYNKSQEKSNSSAESKEEDIGNYISFTLENTIQPRVIYKFSVKNDRYMSIKRKDSIRFDPSKYELHNLFYTSKDGTKVPMTLAYKKGIKLDGSNPTILYGYGGFGASISHYFVAERAAWLEKGGIFAIAHLRGGDEYGEKWHLQGKQHNKMNVFDDFIAAGEFLIDKGYSSKNRLAILGESNGGLLVGASMTLRPDLFRVVLPEVGVLDMLRHDADDKASWINEYGMAGDSKAMYDTLKSYSPYHNVKAGVCYPSTLIVTSKRDDRVFPWHSYKFAAELQEKQGCNNPTFLFTAQQRGHSPNTIAERIENTAYRYAFTLSEMGVKTLPKIPQRLAVEPK